MPRASWIVAAEGRAHGGLLEEPVEPAVVLEVNLAELEPILQKTGGPSPSDEAGGPRKMVYARQMV